MAGPSEFNEALFGCFETLGKPMPSDAALRMWHGMIKHADISYADAIKALGRHMYDPDVGQFLPKPADIIRQLHGTSKQQQQALELASTTAWARVREAIGRIGTYRSVVFDDWRTHAGIATCGGWQALGLTNHDELGVLQAVFRRGYMGAQPGAYPAVCTGMHANQPDDNTVLVGDPDVCRAVMSGGQKSLTGKLRELPPGERALAGAGTTKAIADVLPTALPASNESEPSRKEQERDQGRTGDTTAADA